MRSQMLGPLREDYTRDELGREHICAPRNGPAHTEIRSCKFHDITAANNSSLEYNLMRHVIDETGVSVFRSTHDNGPDADITSWPTLLYTWRNFKKLNGDADSIQKDAYSAYRSRYNDVEHLWGPKSDSLTSYIASAVATGDDVAPCKLPVAACSPADRRMKEMEVFDNACAEIPGFWRRKTFNTHAITTSSIACSQENSVHTSDDHKLVQEYLKAGKAEIAARPELMAIHCEFNLKEALLHADRRRSLLVVQKCPEDDPCMWCKSRP